MRNDSGFTLLEVLVAFVILAFGFVAIVELNSGSIRSATLSEMYLKGVTLAENKFNELDLNSFEMGSSNGIFESEPDYRWELEISPYESTLNDDEFNVNIAQVNLNVLWGDSDREKNFELVTLKILGNTVPATDQMIKGFTRNQTESVSQTKTIEGNTTTKGKPSLPVISEGN